MPVIINEFEIIVEPPQTTQNEEQPSSQPAELTPQDIEQIVAFFTERRARLLAD